ncbi:MAG: hypothetical protein H0U59_01430 [Gemmatimonadaceae bacterium]|nr:hypothetical protein [Gemmatimonadaceae bacterium]
MSNASLSSTVIRSQRQIRALASPVRQDIVDALEAGFRPSKRQSTMH